MATEPAAAAIRLTDVRFRWRPGAPLVLDIPEFEMPAGARVFLAGPSGSGKTTLLNVIGGVAAPEAGAVTVLGTEFGEISGRRRDAFRADHVGFVFQMFNLVPYLSLVDNVVLPCRFSARRRQRAEARSGDVAAEARRLLEHMRLDAATLADRSVAELSVGQQQRAAAARALIGRPELVIADEPTSAVDAEARDAFLALLFEEVEASGASLLFVSHDRSLAPRFDRALSLGELNRAGTA